MPQVRGGLGLKGEGGKFFLLKKKKKDVYQYSLQNSICGFIQHTVTFLIIKVIVLPIELDSTCYVSACIGEIG